MSKYDFLKYIYIGGKDKASENDWLCNKSIVFILNTTNEVPNYFPKQFHYLKLGLYDDKKEIILPFLDNAREHIRGYVEKQCNILIHSNKGLSRCYAILAYYVMEELKCSLPKAMKILKKKYGKDKMNKTFWYQLNSISFCSVTM